MKRRHAVQLETRRARLSEPFGYDFAVRLFGQEAIDSLPLLMAGPNKGKPKGWLHWRKAITAGYVRECCGPRKAGGLVDAWIGEGMGSLRDGAMRGQWFGRIQNLAGVSDLLSQDARDRDAAFKARAEADWQAEKAEMLARAAERVAA